MSDSVVSNEACNKAKTDNVMPEQQKNLKENLENFFSGVISWQKNSAWKEYGLTALIKRENLIEVATHLKNDPVLSCNMLVDVTCVDWLDSKDKRFEVVYQLLSIPNKSRITLKVLLSEEDPVVPSLRPLWSSANFLEREVYDMYGVQFDGHGDLRRILMYDEFVGHPLRKDYPLRGKQPRVKLRVPELRNTSADLSREQLVPLPSRRASSL
ncbi:MAG TPA: NADH-quinone oxidoreductase subunit C [Oligoflexia bacterium]|nr:NADH-quinone oxidoreductase subunit C [Oligoflexia bacterium]HMP47886.1 NADH-quinone oxidoreductase subunit C [Oligoflexia bacterium]